MRWSAETVEWARATAGELGVKPGAVLRRAAEMARQHLDVAAALRAEINGNGEVLRGRRAHPRTCDCVMCAVQARVDGQGSAAAAGKMPAARSRPASPPRDGAVGQAGVAADPRPAAAPGAQLQKLVTAVVRQISTVWPPVPTDVVRARRKIELGHVTVVGVVVKDPEKLVTADSVAVAR